jgi:hypothetical protein
MRRSITPDPSDVANGPLALRRIAVADSKRPIIVTRLLFGATALLFACAQSDPDPWFKLRALHAGVAEFQARNGALPARLEDVCEQDPTVCRLDAAERWIRDQWGTPIRYSKLDSTYQLSSAGADRTFDTRDDMVFSAARDLEIASNLAGCYRIAPSVGALDSDRLHLTTMIARSGGYVVQSPRSVRGDSAFIAEWYPLRADSLLARWIRIDQGVTLRARVVDGRLRGRVGSRTVEGQAVECE